MKKIFLTGSTSYLGSKFIELFGNKFDIFGVARSDSEHPIDLTDFEAVGRAFRSFDPDFVIHTAADLGRDSATTQTILETNPAVTSNLVSLAKESKATFIFTSTEAVYGGKEQAGDYAEDDSLKPRSLYGESKIKSEQIVKSSGLAYLIVRGHRFVGINHSYRKPKQFPDTLATLEAGKVVHLDSIKLFKPTLINNICDVFAHYIENDSHKQVILNLGVEKATTFYSFMNDVAKELGIDRSLLRPDGEEKGWPQNSTLSLEKIKSLGYPMCSYGEMLEVIKQDYFLSK